MRWVIANDHAGLALKGPLLAVFASLGIAVDDLGANTLDSVDYSDFGHAVARAIAEGRYDRGVLICGTGIGIGIAANRHHGVRAALCGDVFSAKMSRMHNDANVLCLGARVVGPGVAEEILRTFVAADFEGGRHQRRIDKIDAC
ncbi:MAG: ribose 5-phosphate isomerase B [Deltaproteobacteria bacterium]